MHHHDESYLGKVNSIGVIALEIFTWSQNLPLYLMLILQAPRAWFQCFAAYITRVGFSHSRYDSSVFIYRQGTDTTYLLLYVDDILIAASSEILLQWIITSLHQEFSMTDLGSFNYFLSISVTRESSRMFLSQGKYVAKILDWAHMVCLHMHDPQEPHFSALKQILRRSTSGYCVFLGNNLLSWSSKRQPTLSHSRAEAEYRGIANAVAETCWLRNQLREGVSLEVGGDDGGFDSNEEEVVPKVDEVSLVDEVFDGAFGGEGE
nr:hypothetical protein [Tanacetum cinerariifolium]